MELKVRRDGESDPLKEGLEQLDHYLEGLGLATGWLVIFDQRGGLPEISERTTTEAARTASGRNVTMLFVDSQTSGMAEPLECGASSPLW